MSLDIFLIYDYLLDQIVCGKDEEVQDGEYLNNIEYSGCFAVGIGL